MRHEGAASVEDVFYRRTRLGLYEPNGTIALEGIARHMSKRLRWSDDQREAQVTAVRRRYASDLQFHDAPEQRDEHYEPLFGRQPKGKSKTKSGTK